LNNDTDICALLNNLLSHRLLHKLTDLCVLLLQDVKLIDGHLLWLLVLVLLLMIGYLN
jgi:hypothetical protein